LKQGENEIKWNVKDKKGISLKAGTYFMHLVTGKRNEINKIQIIN